MEGDCDTAERDAAAANDWEDEGGERVSGAYGGGNAGRGVAWREVDDDKRRRATTRSTILGGDGTRSSPLRSLPGFLFASPRALCLHPLGSCPIPTPNHGRLAPTPP
ncbi:hypothetical protein HU200_031055 [Digitaria exilis]|uniref:Uncharacterized protein n=1 Tax=Digitaria exilis TaxID=1010633 RepID=A0A835BM95_9POAL|nr:hypothetical protein HU200_031055 [Digitaria exilis]